MPTEAEIRSAFALFDTDQSGSVSAAELKAILSRPLHGRPAPLLTDAAIDQLIKRSLT